MNRRNFLEWLRDLEVEPAPLELNEDSEVQISVRGESVSLLGQDICLFLASPHTVLQTFQALGEPADSGVVLISVEVPDEVAEALEGHFNTVEYA